MLMLTIGMIRAKSFQAKKRLPMNRFLDFEENDDIDFVRHCLFYMSAHADEYTHLTNIKSGTINNCEYKITRESNTAAWMVMCPSIIVMYLRPGQLEELEMGMDKTKYCFHVYKTEDFLIVFLVSHWSEQIDLLEFQLFHGCNRNYAILTHALTSFVILNQSCVSKMEMINPIFDLHSVYGEAEPISEITSFVDLVKKLKSLYKTLPVHYLML